MNQLFLDYQRREQERQARLPTYRAALLNLLRRAGASEAVIEYNGEGDSGQIESVTLQDSLGKPLPDKPLSTRANHLFSKLQLFKPTLEGALEAFAWELLSVHHDGFENNEGAYGTITLDVKKRTVTLDHNARFVDVFTSTKEV